MDIIAQKEIKGKILRQRFTELAWKLLGKEKNGWVEVNEKQTISNIQKPNTGQKIENIANEKVKEKQVIENQATEHAAPINKKILTEDEIDEKKISEFMKSIDGFNKGTIKDFFDEQDPPIEYSNKATAPELKKQLAEHFKYDIVKLQEKFGK